MTVIDCFCYNGEMHALAARLALPKIDRWVLVESWTTHSGDRKPCLYHINQLSELGRDLDPRILVVVADLAQYEEPWQRENAQRNCVLSGLQGAGEEDTVLLSDCDELPSPEGIDRAVAALEHQSAVVLQQRSLTFNVDWENPGGWRGTVATTVRHIKKVSPQALRNQRETLPRIENGGEHRSFFGGAAEIQRKVASFAHTEYGSFAADVEAMQQRMRTGRDPFDRWDLSPAV